MLSRASKGNLELISGASRGFYLFITALSIPQKCTIIKKGRFIHTFTDSHKILCSYPVDNI